MRVRVEGFRELDQALEQFKPATATNIARRALRKAAEPLLERASALAPPDWGGDLRASLTKGSRLSKSQRKAHRRESEVEVHVGPGTNPQAITQEFGTRHHPPQPYMRPAWDATKGEVLESIKEDLAEEIDKAATRARRKALRAGG